MLPIRHAMVELMRGRVKSISKSISSEIYVETVTHISADITDTEQELRRANNGLLVISDVTLIGSLAS